jgi:hypothetical protein
MCTLLRSRQNTESTGHHFLYQHVDAQYLGIEYRSVNEKEGTLSLGYIFLDDNTLSIGLWL